MLKLREGSQLLGVQMKLYNPNREERAFLYQEAQDLEPLMKDLGSLSVMIETSEFKPNKKRPRYRVTFVIAPESVGMKVQATDKDLFEAAILAKEEVQRQLNILVNALPKSSQPGDAGVTIPYEFLH